RETRAPRRRFCPYAVRYVPVTGPLVSRGGRTTVHSRLLSRRTSSIRARSAKWLRRTVLMSGLNRVRMKNPSPGSCLGGFGRPGGDGLLEQLPANAPGGCEDRDLHLSSPVRLVLACSFVPLMIRSGYCMSSISSSESTIPHDRKRLTGSIKQSLRALSIQLSLLNHQVSER